MKFSIFIGEKNLYNILHGQVFVMELIEMFKLKKKYIKIKKKWYAFCILFTELLDREPEICCTELLQTNGERGSTS